MSIRINCYQTDSPLGKLILAHGGSGLASVQFVTEDTGTARHNLIIRLRRRYNAEVELVEDARPLEPLIAWLGRYFDNPAACGAYDGPLDCGGTEFQKLVWMQLWKIPAGETRTYSEVAIEIGRPAAARAVGTACGANPAPVVVPCHRIVARNGLGGFSGGLELKRRMLEYEGARLPS